MKENEQVSLDCLLMLSTSHVVEIDASIATKQ